MKYVLRFMKKTKGLLGVSAGGQTCLLTLAALFDIHGTWRGSRESNLREPCTM
jgi:hypothetical protein